jgi:adenosylcobinamide-phosphate synthase
MSFFAVLFALLIEQLKPLPRASRVQQALVAWIGWTGLNFDAGKAHHAWVVWCVSVLVPALLSWGVYSALHFYSLLLALAFEVAVLYLTLGFRQFSHYYTDIRDALDRSDEPEARRLLAEWQQLDVSELPRTELVRHVIEHALLAAHRHVFGVFFWFVVMSALGFGPAGAVLYRLADLASRYWAYLNRVADAPAHDGVQRVAQLSFELLDRVPARLTAFGFAVVGNFEEAVNGWRRDAALWSQQNEGIILAAAAGALGVQLGGRGAPGVRPDRAQGFAGGVGFAEAQSDAATPGVPTQIGHLQSVVALVWRSVVLWMLLVALLSLANIVG